MAQLHRSTAIAMTDILIKGYEQLLEGILIPLAISLAASAVRISLYGWHGLRDYAASLCAGSFAAICTSWVLQSFALPLPVHSSLVGIAAIIGKDTLSLLLSRRSLSRFVLAIRRRLVHEILTRGNRHD